MKALIFQEKVADLANQEFPVSPEMQWVDCDETVKAGWLYDGENFTDPTPPIDLVAFAKKEGDRRFAPITLDDDGDDRVFTPDDTFISRLNSKLRVMEERSNTSANWIFDNGTASVSYDFLKSMGLATHDQWQPYFDNIESIIGQISAGTITTPDQVKAAFDAAYEGE